MSDKRDIITVILANLKADFELFENQLARIRLMNELAHSFFLFHEMKRRKNWAIFMKFLKSLAEINWINLWFKEIYEINWRKLKEWDYYNGKLWNKDKKGMEWYETINYNFLFKNKISFIPFTQSNKFHWAHFMTFDL